MSDTPIFLPEEFVQRILAEHNDSENLLAALDSDVPISVRLHPSKGENVFQSETRVPWCEKGRYLEERPVFTLDPLFHAGCYYPQEAGSMLLDFYMSEVRLPENANMLDLCASPGGKSTVLMDHMREGDVLIANEIIRNRAFVLRDNVSKWGGGQVIVTNNAPSDFAAFDSAFDLVVIDAPCSGEGMFRKDRNARLEWSLENTRICEVRQSDILDQICSSLKRNGILIYSTCTFNTRENEFQMQRLLDTGDFEIVDFPLPKEWGVRKGVNGLGYYAFPHLVQSEGFYSCVLRKVARDRQTFSLSNREQKQFSQLLFKKDMSPYFVISKAVFIEKSDNIFVFPKTDSFLHIKALLTLNCIKWGTRLGEYVNGKLVPNQELAWSDRLSPTYGRIELNRSDALHYLKGEPVKVAGQEGWYVVTHHGQPLGWMKALKNRSNNYYPKELRIRMEIPKQN